MALSVNISEQYHYHTLRAYMEILLSLTVID